MLSNILQYFRRNGNIKFINAKLSVYWPVHTSKEKLD